MPMSDSDLLAKTQEFGVLQQQLANAITKRDGMMTQHQTLLEKIQLLTERIQESRARLAVLRREIQDGA